MVIKLLGKDEGEKRMRAYARACPDPATALDYAARHRHMDVVQLLAPIPPPAIPRDIPPPGPLQPVPVQTHRQYLSLALTEAVASKDPEICEYLISEGADVNFLADVPPVKPPLFYAIHMNNLGLVQLLLASGADPNRYNPYILFMAADGGNLDMIRVLVQAGADVHVRNDQLCNVLTCCTDVEVLRFFLERGVDPNNADIEGDTVLHNACGERRFLYGNECVELLCRFGAMPDKANDVGQTALDLALANQLQDIVSIMEPFVHDPDVRAKIAERWEKRNGA
ncbi:ankyrin repeat-containing domain protein [Mycena olivaceomarginata]|nr:ankyrin repeat-containing domain protein [Mycena olivaceomarginata]